jgi:hypothetical protein
MARENLVRLSDEEKELVKEVRKTKFGDSNVALGVAVREACENYLGEMRLEAANLGDNNE